MLGPRPQAVAQARDRIAAADAAIATAQMQCDLLTIRSPIDGFQDKIHCRLGQTVTIGTVIGEVMDIRQLQALLWLAPRDARLVQIGQKAQLEPARALYEPSTGDSSATTSLPGRVIYIGQAADPQTGNLPIRVLFDNAGQRFKAGQTVTAAITVREKKDALVVPANAIFDLEEGAVLNVVRDGGAVTLHPRLGIREKPWVEVEGTDLKTGEPVIVEGGWSLPDGTKVREKEAAGEPAAEKSAEGT
jgi:RND family efflux transporter MFP subunit